MNQGLVGQEADSRAAVPGHFCGVRAEPDNPEVSGASGGSVVLVGAAPFTPTTETSTEATRS